MKTTVEEQSTDQEQSTIRNITTTMAAGMISTNVAMALAVYLTSLCVMEILTAGMDLMNGTALRSTTVTPVMSFR